MSKIKNHQRTSQVDTINSLLFQLICAKTTTCSPSQQSILPVRFIRRIWYSSLTLVVKKLKIENEALKERLEQAVHLSDMYREQCITAEEEVSKVKDQALRDQNMYQTKSAKLIDKLELTTKVIFELFMNI